MMQGNAFTLSQEALSTESEYTDTMSGPVATCWSRRHQGAFAGVAGIPIAWMSLTGFSSEKAIVLVNGRIESFHKYQELCWELTRQGYDVYALDHRGQGCSGRLTADTQLGHVEEFDDYVSDLHTLIESQVLPAHYRQLFILGHSMGGTVVSLYLARHPDIFDAAALSAPMHGIKISHWMKPIASPLARVAEQLQRQPGYAPGQTPYYPKPFADNPLSQSQCRYAWFRQLYEDQPELKLGGPSSRWVWQALAAARQAVAQANGIQTPLLLLQCSEDQIVDNRAQNLFCQHVRQGGGQCRLSIIQGARHEVLFEQDRYRSPALTEILAHFSHFSTETASTLTANSQVG
ncbi:alpha/beta fold hydrolase [Photobacterium sp. 1_MG-2023]|uniref:alpha/beta fold hydrolase n=1 Tax=Photobacterium sp. 1_MG-2023 TaxID=3062646 RepID=UPI0026E21A32|nr:alpha/beta fold hydrolase [Photobacterium sp. 1_MG-2023]MDO6708517.1 alpha/beta fold hydrolase [Photobacterium sp. 1_MG-2023]